MTWLLPELDDGEEPELKPPEAELDPVELEPGFELEPEFELEPVELELELEFELEFELEPELELVGEEPVEVDALAVCVDAGRTRASAPAAATLATVTAVVADLTMPRPRSLAAMARRIPSRSALVM